MERTRLRKLHGLRAVKVTGVNLLLLLSLLKDSVVET